MYSQRITLILLLFSLIPLGGFAQKVSVTDFAIIRAESDAINASSFPFSMVESESFKSQLRNALTEKLKQEVNATEVVFGQDNAPVDFVQKGVGNSSNVGFSGLSKDNKSGDIYNDKAFRKADPSSADFFAKVLITIESSQGSGFGKSSIDKFPYQLSVAVHVKSNAKKKNKVLKNKVNTKFSIEPSKLYVMSQQFISDSELQKMILSTFDRSFTPKAKLDPIDFKRMEHSKFKELSASNNKFSIVSTNEELTIEGLDGKKIDEIKIKMPSLITERLTTAGQINYYNLKYKNSKEKFQIKQYDYEDPGQTDVIKVIDESSQKEILLSRKGGEFSNNYGFTFNNKNYDVFLGDGIFIVESEQKPVAVAIRYKYHFKNAQSIEESILHADEALAKEELTLILNLLCIN